MDTALKTNQSGHLERVWQGAAARELTEECVIPDSMPDAAGIADAEGVVTVLGKDAETGFVQLAASLSVCVVYMPEAAPGLRSLEVSLPIDLRLEAPGADMDCRATARFRVRSLEARLINSRKLAVRAEVEAEAACYRAAELTLAVDMADDDSRGLVHLRREEAGIMPVADVREKTFAVTDDYAFPAGCGPEARILSRRAEILTEDAQLVGGKVVFRGRVRSELLFGEDGTGAVFAGRYETEFSQIMELDVPEDGALPELSLFFTGVYFDLPEPGAEQGRVRAELHMAAQCVGRASLTAAYLSDAYSNRTELVPARERIPFVRRVRPVVQRQTVAERIEGAERDGELIRASAAVGGVAEEGGAVRASVTVRLLYALPDGRLSVVRGRLPAEFTLPERGPDETLRDVSVTAVDVYCVPGTGDVRVSLRLDALAEEEGAIDAVCALTEDENARGERRNAPSAVLLRSPAGTDLWELARRYHSTTEDILAVNDGRTEGLLLIPKGR